MQLSKRWEFDVCLIPVDATVICGLDLSWAQLALLSLSGQEDNLSPSLNITVAIADVC